MSGPEIMRALQYFFFVICGLMIWSCEVEPFDVNSLADTDNIPTEEVPEDNEDEMPPLNAGELRFKVDERIYLTDQTNGEIADGSITITGIEGLNGESINMMLEGEGSGTYLFDMFNIATYNPSSVDRPYSTSVHFGEGFVNITDVDLVNSNMSGLFELIAYRESLDDEGNVVYDQFGVQVFDLVTLTEGEFYMIPIN